MRVAIASATALAVTLTLGACGGAEEPPAARRSAARWATAVCTDLGRWFAAAADDTPSSAADAALRLRAGIARVDPPDTDDGLAAQGEVEKLAIAIERRVRGGNPPAIEQTVAEARSAIDGIRGLTPGGAVESALDEVGPCRALRG